MITVDPTGARASSLAENEQQLSDDWRQRLGDDLSLEPETPQRQIISVEALALTEVGEAIVESTNGWDLDRATGAQLDAIGSILRIRRLAGRHSLVTATLDGVSGTVIPSRTRARTAAGAVFETISTAILEDDPISVEMRSVAVGPIAAAAGELTEIATIIVGWETVTNAAAATLGELRQSDASYRAALKALSARNGIGAMTNLAAAIAETRARRYRIHENRTANAQTIQGFTLAPHAILVVAEGGDDADLTRAIETHRGMGAPTMSAFSGGDPDESALARISAGDLSYDGVAYTALDLSGTTTPAERAAALAAKIGALTGVNYFWPSDGYYVAMMEWQPGRSPAFSDDAVTQAFGLDPDHVTAPPGPFIRPRERALSVTIDVTIDSLFPADGLQQIRELVSMRVLTYRIGETIWSNDIQALAETLPGTRVTSLRLLDGTRDVSGAEVPIDAVWTLDPTDLTINLTNA